VSEESTVRQSSRRRRVALEAGVRIGSYTLTGREIGSGGYAHVYEASHPALDLRVAIKIQDSEGDSIVRARGLQEATVLARIQHRNVVQIFDAGELDDGRQYLAMELLTGSTLRDVLAGGPPQLAQALPILRGIASALDAVHARGLVHRDLKPSNIFLCRDDDGEIYPKLIDFGIAKDLSLSSERELTTSGSFIGTPSYMSPEQCLGKRTIDARSDIYALGVVAYQLLAGDPPFDGVVLEVAHAHAHAPVPSIHAARRDLPSALDAVFERVLAKDPDKRPATATEAIDLICEALADPGSHMASGKRRVPLIAAAGFALVVIALAVSISLGRSSASLPAPSAAGRVDATVVPPPDASRALPVAADDAAIAGAVAPITDAASSESATPNVRHRPPRHHTPSPSIDDVESLPPAH
jgi:serine/threonine-protein kinase